MSGAAPAMANVQDRRTEPNEAARTVAFTVVIPCYNEEQSIAQTIRSIRAVLPSLEEHAIIVVDDGSTDGSAAVLSGLERGDGNLRVVRHPRNRGYGAALKTGIEEADTEYVVITDADGTYPNERIPELVEIARQADMVVGARVDDDVVYPLIRKVPKAFLQIYASWLCGRKIPDLNSGLRVLRRSVVQRFLRILPDTFSFTTTITIALHTNGYDLRYIPISYAARVGKSKIRPIRDTLNFINLIVRTGTYFAPMRVFFPVSVLLFLGCIGSALYDVFVIDNLTDKTVLLALFSMNTGMFALLADMIDKRM
jgi:glycosyltransferase involved in cell wall biosynthesis